MNTKKIILIAVILTVIGLLIYNQTIQKDQEDALSPEEAIEQVEDDIEIDEPPVKISQGAVVGIKDDKKEWMIKASNISIAEDRKKTVFNQIEKMVIYKEEEPHLNISAQQCIADMDSKDMELQGNVRIETKEGDFLTGEKILWHSDDQRLSSQEKVELKVDDHHIIAGALSTNMELTRLQLDKRVKVIMKL